MRSVNIEEPVNGEFAGFLNAREEQLLKLACCAIISILHMEIV